MGKDTTKLICSTEIIMSFHNGFKKTGNWTGGNSRGKSLGYKPVKLQINCYHDSGDCKVKNITGLLGSTLSPWNAKIIQLSKAKAGRPKCVSGTNLSPYKMIMFPVSFISDKADQII